MSREILQDGVNVNLDTDHIRQELGAPRNPLLFPPHFLKATFPKIGGRIVIFPQEDGNFTARVARSSGSAILDSEMVQALNNTGLPCTEVYNPEGKHTFNATHKLVDGIDIGRPNETEAAQVRELQRQVWGSTEDFLYPSDVHSEEFKLATTLVARQEGKPVGLLFGFYKFGHELPCVLSEKYDGEFRVESQIMGVSTDSRFKGIGTNLKKEQAIAARAEGIDVINWTVDPNSGGLEWSAEKCT